MMLRPSIVSRAALPFTVAMLAAAPAHADPQAEARARALFDEGRAAIERGDLSVAAEKFTEARAAFPTSGSLYNLADCEERLGRLTAARIHWSQLQLELKPGDTRLADAKAHLDALDRRIATVKLLLPEGAPAGTTMTLDGATVAAEQLSREQPLDPGRHVLEVTAPGHERKMTAVAVAEGARQLVLRGELGPATGASPVVVPSSAATTPPPGSHPTSAPPSMSEPAADVPSGPRTTLAYVSGGVGVAGLALAGVSSLVLLGQKGTIADHCDANKVCDAKGIDAVNGVSTWSALGTAGFVLGAAGIGGFFLLPRGAAQTAVVEPVAGPGVAAVRLSGRW